MDAKSKVRIICKIHGVFEQRANAHLQGSGCPICAKIWSKEHKENLKKSSRKSRGFTTEEWIKRACIVHGNKYDYSKTVYVNQRTDVLIICLKHGPFKQKADSHIRGFGCRFCGYESGNHIGCHEWSEEQRVKTAETCLKKYGATRYLDSRDGIEKMFKIRNNPEFRLKLREIIKSDEIQRKTRETCLKRYGVECVTKLKSVQDKIYKTKKLNHTVTSSLAEVCDFYIKSLNLFIELNLHWSHGKKWFNENDNDDVLKLNRWIEKSQNSLYYRQCICTWTQRDINKRNIALKNNLNYLVFWDNDLSDFLQWLNCDEIVLNNIKN